VAIVVYNRLANLQAWFACWQKAPHREAKLLVIHNYDGHAPDPRYQEVSTGNCDWYVARPNKGFDSGSFQDLCLDRLPGWTYAQWPWDALLWVVDDTLPLQKDFLQPFFSKLFWNPAIGLMCSHLSDEHSLHARTNCFCLRHEDAIHLKFPKKVIRTKEDCYEFEHRGVSTLTKQIQRLGLKVVQVSEGIADTMWDTGHYAHLNRWSTLHETFPATQEFVP